MPPSYPRPAPHTIYMLEPDSVSGLPPWPQAALPVDRAKFMPLNPTVRKARYFRFPTLTCEESPHGVGKSPTSISESKKDKERNFFNLVKGIYKPQ